MAKPRAQDVLAVARGLADGIKSALLQRLGAVAPVGDDRAGAVPSGRA